MRIQVFALLAAACGGVNETSTPEQSALNTDIIGGMPIQRSGADVDPAPTRAPTGAYEVNRVRLLRPQDVGDSGMDLVAERWLCAETVNSVCVVAVPDGRASYSKGGAEVIKGSYANGRREGEWVSAVLVLVPPEMALAPCFGGGCEIRGNYTNGDPVGEWTTTHVASGVRVVAGSYADGHRVGTWTSRDTDGRVIQVAAYTPTGCYQSFRSETWPLVTTGSRPCGTPDDSIYVTHGIAATTCTCSSWGTTETTSATGQAECAALKCPGE